MRIDTQHTRHRRARWDVGWRGGDFWYVRHLLLNTSRQHHHSGRQPGHRRQHDRRRHGRQGDGHVRPSSVDGSTTANFGAALTDLGNGVKTLSNGTAAGLGTVGSSTNPLGPTLTSTPAWCPTRGPR
ncbi:MAG: hypothetical protein CPDRYDRY_0509 [uncultured Paraburkholderia sp.]|nr:MAG: hypothetical protein CPDRYDRY_0509 [uncultured Paraburkholderia sp.]